jgi:putative GTP pyrophosphokinase
MIDEKVAAKYATEVDALIAYYLANTKRLKNFQVPILGYLNHSDELQNVIHSMTSRLKTPESLRDKLLRKAEKCEVNGAIFDITPDNLFERVNDLIGFRLLHIYTNQIEIIDPILRQIISDEELVLLEGPVASVWDREYEKYFQGVGIKTEQNERMYTSVHYVIGSGSKFNTSCEIQVRTLTQEVWGEVDHEINYPHPIESVSCAEQLKTLARATSSAGRLVDSIYASVAEYHRQTPKIK